MKWASDGLLLRRLAHSVAEEETIAHPVHRLYSTALIFLFLLRNSSQLANPLLVLLRHCRTSRCSTRPPPGWWSRSSSAAQLVATNPLLEFLIFSLSSWALDLLLLLLRVGLLAVPEGVHGPHAVVLLVDPLVGFLPALPDFCRPLPLVAGTQPPY